LGKCFGAGAILTTGLVHILPDAGSFFAEAGLEYPLASVLALAAILAMLFFETVTAEVMRGAAAAAALKLDRPTDAAASDAVERGRDSAVHNVEAAEPHAAVRAMPHCSTSSVMPFPQRTPSHSTSEKAGEDVARRDADHAAHPLVDEHSHLGPLVLASTGEQTLRELVVLHLLELGIIFHSIVIGVDLGLLAGRGDSSTRTLFIAVCFHQCFEGFSLGCTMASVMNSSSIRPYRLFLMGAMFTLTTPVGVVIGSVLADRLHDEQAFNWTAGSLNGVAAGLLIYVAIASLLVPEFSHPSVRGRPVSLVAMGVATLLGAAVFSVLAIWA
jgi:zinc transporter 1/2/3